VTWVGQRIIARRHRVGALFADFWLTGAHRAAMLELQRARSPLVLCGLTVGALLAACAPGSVQVGPTGAPRADPSVKMVTSAPSPHTEKWIDLKVGECVADLPPADLSRVNVTVVDCSTAHLAEVYRRAPMAVDSAVTTVADRDCNAGFAPYTGQSIGGGKYTITYLIDSNQDRTGADPAPSTVICLLQAANGQPLTGSAHR
jgi:hypothetical protein